MISTKSQLKNMGETKCLVKTNRPQFAFIKKDVPGDVKEIEARKIYMYPNHYKIIKKMEKNEYEILGRFLENNLIRGSIGWSFHPQFGLATNFIITVVTNQPFGWFCKLTQSIFSLRKNLISLCTKGRKFRFSIGLGFPYSHPIDALLEP